MNNLKLALIGNRGHWGYVFQSLDEVPGIEIVGVASGSSDPTDGLEAAAAKHGFSPKVYSDYRRMFDESGANMVSIDGPFDLHAEMCVEALKRNINVFCEKPIALSLASLEAIEAAYAQSTAKIVSMVGLRYDPAFHTAWKLVKAGAIGKLKLIGTRKSYRLGSRPPHFRTRATYGGTIPWVGSHALDWILFFGGKDFVAVWANQSSEDNFDHGELEVAAQCQFMLKDGLMASASIDYLRPAAAPTHGDDRVRLAGTAGVIEVAGGKVMLIDAEGEREIPSSVPDRKLFSDFALDVMGVRPGLSDAKQTFDLTRACLNAQLSADTGKIVYF